MHCRYDGRMSTPTFRGMLELTSTSPAVLSARHRAAVDQWRCLQPCAPVRLRGDVSCHPRRESPHAIIRRAAAAAASDITKSVAVEPVELLPDPVYWRKLEWADALDNPRWSRRASRKRLNAELAEHAEEFLGF